MTDVHDVTLTLPVAMALAGTAVTIGISGVVWIVTEIRRAVTPIAEQVRGHETRITRLEVRADHAPARRAA
jgi:hypothetical protein